MKRKKSKSRPKHLRQSDWEDVDSPALSDAMLKRMRPAKKVLPAAFLKAMQEGRVGRPKSESTKQAISLRLDEDIVRYFRKTGAGWQSRINAALRQHLPR